MGYSTTYAGLKADLLQDADDYSADYMANLDTIIADSETKVLRDLDLEFFQDEVTTDANGAPLVLTVNSRIFARPPGLLKLNALWLVTAAGSRQYREKRTKGYCEMYGEDPTVTEFPSYYAEQSEASLYFVNTPDQAYPVVAYGIVRPPGLSESVPTTWISTYAGDLLFTACKIYSGTYLTDSNSGPAWSAMYQNDKLPKAKLELRGLSRATYDAAKMASTASQQI